MRGLIEWLILLLLPFVLLAGGLVSGRAAFDKESGGAKRIAAGVGSVVAFGGAFAVIGFWVWLVLLLREFQY
jgi:hypothetical protein